MPDALDQVMDTHHGLVEHLPQLAQLVSALCLEVGRHIACGNPVHHLTQVFQGRAGGNVEAAVEVDDQQEHHHQRHHQQHHLCSVLGQPLTQLAIEERQQAVIEGVGLGHFLADLIVELRPGRIQAVGDDHLILEQYAAVLQTLATGFGQAAQPVLRRDVTGQCLLQIQAVLGMQLLQLQQQVIELGAGRRIEKTLPQGIGADGAALAEHIGDLRGDVGDQLGNLPHLALRVLAQPRLAGHQFDEDLGRAQQFLDDDGLALQRGLGLCAFQLGQQFVALGNELRCLLGIAGHRLQPLQAGIERLLQLIYTPFQIPRLTGLTDHRVDLHQIVEAFKITAQLQAAAE